MNNSTSNPNQTFTDGFRVGASVFSIILIVVMVFGNSLVIAAFATFSRLRTATNYFVVSLAVTDLCVALFSMPVWVAYLLTGPQWVLGHLLNRIWTIMDVLSGTASIATLTAISLDRCICIKKPLLYYQYITTARVRIAIVIIWVYSVTMATTSYFMWQYRVFNFIASIMYFWVPLLIIITTYSIVFRVALQHFRRISVVNVEPTERTSIHQRYSFVREFKAAKTLAVVVGAFIVCWLPFVVINAIYSTCKDQACPYAVSTILILVSKWMHYGNSLLNPPIYGFLNKDFRVAFKTLIFCKEIAFRGDQFTENPYGKARIVPAATLELQNSNRAV